MDDSMTVDEAVKQALAHAARINEEAPAAEPAE